MHSIFYNFKEEFYQDPVYEEPMYEFIKNQYINYIPDYKEYTLNYIGSTSYNPNNNYKIIKSIKNISNFYPNNFDEPLNRNEYYINDKIIGGAQMDSSIINEFASVDNYNKYIIKYSDVTEKRQQLIQFITQYNNKINDERKKKLKIAIDCILGLIDKENIIENILHLTMLSILIITDNGTCYLEDDLKKLIEEENLNTLIDEDVTQIIISKSNEIIQYINTSTSEPIDLITQIKKSISIDQAIKYIIDIIEYSINFITNINNDYDIYGSILTYGPIVQKILAINIIPNIISRKLHNSITKNEKQTILDLIHNNSDQGIWNDPIWGRFSIGILIYIFYKTNLDKSIIITYDKVDNGILANGLENKTLNINKIDVFNL